METETKVVDVIVVGAGIAGLVAAESLLGRDSHLSVLVLEASDRLGGRICDQKIDVANGSPVEVDLGGEWIPSTHTNMLQLVDRLGLKTYTRLNDDSCLQNIIEVGQKCTRRMTTFGSTFILPTKPGLNTGIKSWMAGLEMLYITRKLDQMSAAIDLTNPYHYFGSFGKRLKSPLEFDSTTMDSFLKETTRFQSVRDIIQIQIQHVTGHNLNSISLLFFILYLKSNYPKSDRPFTSFLGIDSNLTLHRVNKGAFQICRRLSHLIGTDNILFNQPVQSISFRMFPHASSVSENTDLVYVSTSTGQLFAARRIVLAVPPSSTRNIDFSPPLPVLKKYLLDRMSMGSYLKFILSYEEAFWIQKGFSGQILTNGGLNRYDTREGISIVGAPVTVLNDSTGCNKVPTLTGYLGGRLAVEWTQIQNDEILHHILSYLTAVFGTWVQEYAGFSIKTWNKDSFVGGGSLCVPVVGTMFAYHALRQSFGPIHFAGTETAINAMGTMSGAVESGIVAAVRVLDDIKPQSLTSQTDLENVKCFSDPRGLVFHDYAILKSYQDFGLRRDQCGKASFANRNALSWTLVLPVLGISVACFVFRMCERYGRLMIPR